MSETEVRRLAESIVGALLKQGFVRPKADGKALAERVGQLLLDDLKAEQALEAEAERLAEKHSRQMAGMDQRKIVLGIKARLAKERGFTL